ncbi:hypothetical protein RM863_11655 [Streptomyces sp. DSM 41014]|uniref:Uncharacterized protein n=1 Tax=Streptomyces hintoniae TaxID=3075521 RepID=A0ABU2UHQ3_9ACTN|nr:hypothetical protein [Streptomyces sp. DSM 41014]MDT0472781.1 hypothetical protein [Streptomyces sp. DSM 41014]
MRFLSGRAATLRHTFLDDEDVMAVPAVSVTVRDASGATVYTGSASSSGDEWRVTSSPLPIGVYTASWVAEGLASDQDNFEVTGGFLFTIPEARASDSDLEDKSRFPAAKVRHYREVVEAEFERITGRSFTPRSTQAEVEGDGTRTLYLGYLDVTAIAAVNGPSGPLDVTSWTVDPHGFVTAPYDLPEGTRYTVAFTYGFALAPDDVKRAGLIRLRSLLTAERSGVPDRATAFVAAEGGNFTLATPGRGGSETGIPEVDATLKRYRFEVFYDVFGVGQ